MAKYIVDSEILGTVKIYKDEVSIDVFEDYSSMFNAKVNEDFVEFNTINIKLMEEQEEDELENSCYENKKMGDFLGLLGFAPDEITSYIINGSDEDIQNMVMKAKKQ